VTSFFGIGERFSRKGQDGSARIFLGFRRKHLFIRTCIDTAPCF